MLSSIVCHCNLVTVHEIEKVIDNGFYSLEDVANLTGASTSCGRCRVRLQQIIDKKRLSVDGWQTSINWNLVAIGKNNKIDE